MKNIKKFDEFLNENYNQNTHQSLNIIRNSSEKGFMKKISKFLSVIHDIINLDFKSAYHSFKNKSGFDKLIL